MAIGDDDQLAALQKCLLLLHLFGGIGSRSRRGWGSVAVEMPGNFLPSRKANQQVDDWFKSALLSLWPSNSNPLKTKSTPAYSAFSQDTLICISTKTWDYGPEGYKDVLKEFFQRMKAIRDYKTGTFGLIDHQNEYKDYGNDSFSHIPKRIAFGLPYQAISRTSAMGMRYKGMLPIESREKEIERRASPLFLKVLLAPNNRLHAVSLFLKARFFGNKDSKIGAEKRIPGGYRTEDSWNLLNQRLAFSDWSAVEAFLKHKDWQKIL
jgi:CRISPR-associated protein Cmr1